METKNINLSAEAQRAITSLQHVNGTYSYYSDTLKRLYNFVLNMSDEIGMSDGEAIATLRALHALRADIADIAGTVAVAPRNRQPSAEETAAAVEATFEDMKIDEPEAVNDLDEPREMLSDITRKVSEACAHTIKTAETVEKLTVKLQDLLNT